MPPWSDWLDYFGADAIGRVVGLWLKFCFKLPRLVLSRLNILHKTGGFTSGAQYGVFTHAEVSGLRSAFAKTRRITMATLATLVVWAIVTSKPLWNAVGAVGDRILAGLLMLVNVTWLIVVVWTFFSQPRKKKAR